MPGTTSVQQSVLETQRTPGNGWGKRNTEKIKPSDYYKGGGTGFLAGETFPGVI
ncbi:MAG: hypothetical protein ACH350_10265 [Parachlamydiaceae bacterium]